MSILPTKYGIGKFPDPLAKTIANPSTTVGRLDQFLGSPGGGFLMNLLAQSGYSTTPQSPFGAIGRASLLTQQQNQQRETQGLTNDLLRARIGLTKAQAQPQNLNPSAGNVQSTFEGDNGNQWIITRSGQVRDTGVPYSSSIQLVERADGTTVAVDKRTGNVVGTPVTPDQARDDTLRGSQNEAVTSLPTDLAALDSVINQVDATVQKIEDIKPLTSAAGLDVALRGNLPGELGGDARELKQSAKSLQANLGFDTLQKMRAASKTGGALGQVSERELDLLVNAIQAIDIEGRPETLRKQLDKVILHYNNYKREIEVMKNAMRKEAGVEEVAAEDSTIPDLSSMSDEELRRIAEGG